MAKKTQASLLPKAPLTVEHRIYQARKLIADIPFTLTVGQPELQDALANVLSDLQAALQVLKGKKDTTSAL